MEKNKHFIPSPFKVVTQYENAFIKEWQNNTAKCMMELLKYISDVTSKEIKGKEKE